MRVVALLATYDEERFVGGCIEHLAAHGVETYLIDNESTDCDGRDRRALPSGAGSSGSSRSRATARTRGSGSSPARRELAATLDADWFLHVDADEIRLPPRTGVTLADALAEVDREGYNAVNFLELTFVPTREHPDHDHPRYQETMRWYYPFLRERLPTGSTRGSGRTRPSISPRAAATVWTSRAYACTRSSFPMRHYLYLSVEHAIRKYVERVVRPRGGRGRAGTDGAPRSERRTSRSSPRPSSARYVSDDLLDASEPWTAASALRASTGRRAIVSDGRGLADRRRRLPSLRARASCGASSTRTRGSTAGPRSRSSATSTATSRTTRSRTSAIARTVAGSVPEDEALDVLGRAFVELHERAAAESGQAALGGQGPGERPVHGGVGAPAEATASSSSTWCGTLSTRSRPWRAASRSPSRHGLEDRVDLYRTLHGGGSRVRRTPPRSLRAGRLRGALRRRLPGRSTSSWLGSGKIADPGQLAFNEQPHQAGPRGSRDPLDGRRPRP